MVTPDGIIRTIAGGAVSGFNGDNQPATAAYLTAPQGIAVDTSGNIFVADGSRIRKFTVGGMITTVAGTGISGQPVDGLATATPLGTIAGLYLDSSNNLYAADSSNNVVLKIKPDGTLNRIAGNFDGYGASGDGVATSVSVLRPRGVTWHSSGSIFITDEAHLVRKLSSDGRLTAVAGRIHFAGDGGPASRALLNQPTDVALDKQGNVFIADAKNFRIRKVSASGTIDTYAGTGIPGTSPSGAVAPDAQLPYVYAMTADASGAIYLATFYRILKISPGGMMTVIAGTGELGATGDGGPATSATIEGATSIAVDSAGNIYFADGNANRVRKITTATGIITAYAGTGARGFTGDGGQATAAQLSMYPYTSLAVDSKGNLYIGDGYNYRVRMVNAAGIISTVVGNGRFGRPDQVQATAAGFSTTAALACDDAGNLYIASEDYADMYVVTGGIIRRILGDGPGYWLDGTPADSTYLYSNGIKVDQNGDIYGVSCCGNTVLKLVLNSPASLSIADGNSQSAQTGQSLTRPLTVQLNGRAGIGLAGATVNFAVTSGSATLTAISAQTDPAGRAAIGVTLGSAPGDVIITASVTGTGVTPVRFTETATPPSAPCSVPQPVVVSVNSAGDFGGAKTFAPGSWLEIKGTNLAPVTRSWGGSDFSGPNAPTSLDGVFVTINGKRSFVGYISPSQINVQAPADTTSGNVQITVTTSSCTSTAFSAPESPIAPGLLAPSSFKVGGTQYLVAVFQDGVTFVGRPDLISGAPFRAAAPGETVTLYGIGFGSVTPATTPGMVASGTSGIPNLTVSFGVTEAQSTYAGLAPGAVGLYQFNVVVPDIPDGDYPIAFRIGSTTAPQLAFLTVHR